MLKNLIGGHVYGAGEVLIVIILIVNFEIGKIPMLGKHVFFG